MDEVQWGSRGQREREEYLHDTVEPVVFQLVEEQEDGGYKRDQA